MFPCRLIVDPPQTGVWNMAVDECLLEEAAKEGIATLRFYQWSEPTLSLGYFQKYEDRRTHPESQALPAVRRLSGGGTLLHDHELTYSLSLPANHPQTSEPRQIYRQVHQAAVVALAAQRLRITFWGDFMTKTSASKNTADAFLCFERLTDDDLVLPREDSPLPAKVLGSAQRRRRGAVLQHGALLLAESRYAPQLPGIAELRDTAIDLAKLRADWGEKTAARLGLQLAAWGISPQFKKKVQLLAEERLRSNEWIRRR